MKINIDEFGQIVESSKSKYELTLSGSYYFSCFGYYVYEVSKSTPTLPLSNFRDFDNVLDIKQL
jgi:hypothetical protein